MSQQETSRTKIPLERYAPYWDWSTDRTVSTIPLDGLPEALRRALEVVRTGVKA